MILLCPVQGPKASSLVIFMQNGASLGNNYAYMCLDIMPQQEGTLPSKHIYLNRDV